MLACPLLAVPGSTRSRRSRFDAVREQAKRFPRRSNLRLVRRSSL